MAGITNHVETIYEFKETGHASLLGKTEGLTNLIERGRMALPGFSSELGQIPGLFGGLVTGAGSAAGAVGGLATALVGYGALVFKLTSDHDALKREMAGSLNAAFSFKGAHTPMEQYKMSLEAAEEQMTRFSDMQRETGATTLELSKTFGFLTSAADRTGKGPAEIEKATRTATLATKAMGLSLEEVNLGLLTMMETGMARGEFGKRLGLIGKDMSNLTATQRWDTVMGAMNRWGVAGEESAKRPAAQLRVMMSTLDELFVQASRPTFDTINSGIGQFVDFVMAHKAGIGDFFKGLSMEFGIMGKILRETVLPPIELVVAAMEKFGELTGKIFAGGVADPAEVARAQAEMASIRTQSHATEAMLLSGNISKIQEAFGGASKLPVASAKTLIDLYRKDYEAVAGAGLDDFSKKAMARPSGALGAAQVNVTNNFGDIHMHNDFKDVEPNRILLAIREELENAGENRTQARTSLAHAS